jgi:hypothetical protein
VQRKAVNWVTGLAGDSYYEKCKELGLSTLESRRWEQDMVQVYKILNGIGNIRAENFFAKISERNGIQTRLATGFNNLTSQRARTDLRKNTFSMRVVQSWNSLPDTVKTARTVLGFKNGIKLFIENGGRPGYE